MALVVLLRGVNVGGHRTFRPTTVVRRLRHLDAVNVGAAGTFVIRRPISRTRLRAEFTRLLPFDTEIMICDGRELMTLLSRDYFAGDRERPDVVRFVSVLSRQPRLMPSVPLVFPARGPWLLKVLAVDKRLVVGLYRRQMRAIRYLSALDDVFGVPATTRSWGTLAAVCDVLRGRRLR